MSTGRRVADNVLRARGKRLHRRQFFLHGLPFQQHHFGQSADFLCEKAQARFGFRAALPKAGCVRRPGIGKTGARERNLPNLQNRGLYCAIDDFLLQTFMSFYRRVFIPGGCYFFTVNLLERHGDLLVTQIQCLRQTVRQVRARRPFRIDAWVVLPDHLHCIWTLPPDDMDYATRWKEIKAAFSKTVPRIETVSLARARQGERGIWQHRYWEHAIRDERDYVSHMDYCYINPFKHGLVERVCDWPYSTFHRDVKNGIYPENWACEPPNIKSGE